MKGNLHWTLAIAAEMNFVTFANSTLVGTVSFAFWRFEFECWMAWLFAWATAQHFQINDQTFVDTNRIDLECLEPVSWIWRAWCYHNFGCETNNITNFKSIAFCCCNRCTVSQTCWIICDFNGARCIIFHFNRWRNFLDLQRQKGHLKRVHSRK